MSQEPQIINSNFSLPKWDSKKISTVIIALALLGGVGFLFYTYILPWLLTIVWGTVQLIVAAVVAVFLLGIVTNSKFWRGMNYLCEGIARWTLGLVIEMNPFNILYLQVENAEKEREQLKVQGDKLKAQEQSLITQVDENNKTMQQSAAEIKILKERLAANPNNFDSQLQLQTSSTNFANAKEFIDQVKPLLNDITKLVDFTDKAYKKSGVELLNAKNTIKIRKATYDAVTTGSMAMKKAMGAFFGKTNLNNDADKALEVLRNDVAQKIGTIKSAISVTNDIMNQNDLRDAAKINLAAETALQFENDANFNYPASSGDSPSSFSLGQGQISTSQENKYIDFLKK